ncbi:MAG: bifunctional phosphoribosyl-AMP cyclohydrolase/phosphoribosyl-ATP diphosphatase HisIE [Solirubrobacteraceae bacterium]|nr:bifunctional phosphoribosyl-AMP cyclohydrolase/phosphoribosyl-ATP diphosphatase HisIE [Solirubrobacteraceae bacterium]
MEISFDDNGLVPVVAQDAGTGEVLMLAWANAEALELTEKTGELHLWSRSRQEIWHKGATSGAVQRVVAIRSDCDGDALVALVEPAGPACHTGARSCFAQDDGQEKVPHEALPVLQRTIDERAATRPEGSYTASLLEDPELAGAKVTEEAAEVVQAVASESDERVDEEAADLLYHLSVLLSSRGRSIPDAARVLLRRAQ